METLHATCVVLDGKGVLLCGPPGSGKSDLALRLIDGGALLIADDLVAVEASGEDLIARFPDAPNTLKGVIEVRGVGFVRMPWQEAVKVVLCVHLSPMGEVARWVGEDRLSQPPHPPIPCGMGPSLSHRGEGIIDRLPALAIHTIAGIEIPSLILNAFEASAPAKIRAALGRERIDC